MRTSHAWALAATILACSACSQGEATIRKDVDARRAAYSRAMEAGDTVAIRDFWSSDAVIRETGITEGAEEFRAFMQDFVNRGNRIISLKYEPSDVFIHGVAVYEVGTYSTDYQLVGKEPVHADGNYFVRWIYDQDAWRMHRMVTGPGAAAATP